MAAAVGDIGAHVDHIFTVAERYVPAPGNLDGFQLFLDVRRLARERCLLDLQGCALHDSCVRGNTVSCLQHDDISRHQFLGWYRLLMAAAQDLGCRRGDLLQRFDGCLRLVLLVHAQAGIDNDDQQNNKCVCKALPCVNCRNRADACRDNQDDGHGIPEFCQEFHEKAFLFRLLQFVRAIFAEPLRRLRVGQALHR